MLYRLLIAFFALTMITACGSSSSNDDPPPSANGNGNGGDNGNGTNGNGNGGDNGNGTNGNGNGGDNGNGNGGDNGNGTNGNGNGNGGDNGNGNGGDTEAPELPEEGDLSFRFVDSIDGWHLNGTGNTTTLDNEYMQIAHDSEHEALTLTPKDWEADNWRLQARYELEEGVNFVDATVILVADIPQAYLDDEALAIQLILLGNSGDSYGDFITLAHYDAETQRIELDLGERADDLSHIGIVAIQFAQPPADEAINDPIAVRSLDFYLAHDDEEDEEDENGGTQEPEGDIVYSFSDNIDDWYLNGAGPGTTTSDNIEIAHDAEAGAMVITPINWGADTWQLEPRADIPATDLSGATITFVVDIPQSYADDGNLRLQLSADGQYLGWLEVVAGENTLTGTVGDDIATEATSFGIQLARAPTDEDIKDPILVKSVAVVLATEEEEEEDNSIQLSLESGWRTNPGAVEFDYIPEGVTYSPVAENDQLVYDLAGPADVHGRVLEVALQVDQAFIDSGASLELLIQEKGSWSGSFCAITETLEDQVPALVTCTANADNELLSPAEGEEIQLGIQAKGSPAGTVRLMMVQIRDPD
ncbi:family 15 carbohydrate-binding domain-containing protein [Marinimicrobium alkaliphilum]|uniref:family 15 carbohydrate-binding domain-containing protein n=1 Tax=Marinimicrobium alkaliphilum TaxID=2202654 RepID=UPI000DBA8C30|nr:family 15 carbohydrate-binding domain-containing protein [Marinimicrobium alkaliphilum]